MAGQYEPVEVFRHLAFSWLHCASSTRSGLKIDLIRASCREGEAASNNSDSTVGDLFLVYTKVRTN